MNLPWKRVSKPYVVAVVGDIILDEYLYGSVDRISPEAPVPVHSVNQVQFTPGGAANVAHNVQMVGGQAHLFGVWGKDESARCLETLLKEKGIRTEDVISLDDRPTIKKTRILSKNQQMIRIDWEKTYPLIEKTEQSILNSLKKLSPEVVVLSDYGKGLLSAPFVQKIIALASERKCPVVVDPKGKDFSRYQGCTLITPNLKEAYFALGESEEAFHKEKVKILGESLQTRFGLGHVLITLGADGMMLFPEKTPSHPIHSPSKAREVYDVSGAGDTVVAIISLCLAASVDFPKAMDLANVAAGLVVEKIGTQPVYAKELEQALHEEHVAEYSHKKKILPLDALKEELELWRTKGKKIVFTNGCFDLLHVGHLEYLEASRSHGDLLAVGVNTDASIKRLKGSKRPLVPLEDRLKLLAGMACVSYVVSFDEDTPLSLIQALKPDVLTKGADYTEDQIVGAREVKEWGGMIARIPLVPGRSTTELIQKIGPC